MKLINKNWRKTQGILGYWLIGLTFRIILYLPYPPNSSVAGSKTNSQSWLAFRSWYVTAFAYLTEACVLLRWFTNLGVDHVHAHFGTNSTL